MNQPRVISDIEGYEMVEKQVKRSKGASSAHIYLPADWEGKNVLIVRTE